MGDRIHPHDPGAVLTAPSDALAAFNALEAEAASAALLTCCSSPAWARAVAAARPYRSVDALATAADQALAALGEDELDAALAGHPRIGERSAHASSQREQAAVSQADAALLEQLARGNTAYKEKFGHVYLVRAAGRSAEELLRLLTERLAHDAPTERRIAREQLGEINRLRLERLLMTDPAEVTA